MAKYSGTYSQIVYSPKGGVEGFLAECDGEPVQFVLAKDDEPAAALVSGLAAGQQLVVVGDAAPPSKKGAASHRVVTFVKLQSIDGAKPAKGSAKAPGYSGRIVRLNYARHGAPNGYLLDSGDFIHVKPDGFAKLRLGPGDTVEVEGDAHFLTTGGGWAVEADSVNGQAL